MVIRMLLVFCCPCWQKKFIEQNKVHAWKYSSVKANYQYQITTVTAQWLNNVPKIESERGSGIFYSYNQTMVDHMCCFYIFLDFKWIMCFRFAQALIWSSTFAVFNLKKTVLHLVIPLLIANVTLSWMGPFPCPQCYRMTINFLFLDVNFCPVYITSAPLHLLLLWSFSWSVTLFSPLLKLVFSIQIILVPLYASSLQLSS